MTAVVYVHTDNSRGYVEPYGYDVPTPAIQSITEDGLLCRQAISPAPTCSRSHAAMKSGSSPHSNGLNGLAHLGFSMDDYSQHLVGFLGRNGYETALGGHRHEANPTG